MDEKETNEQRSDRLWMYRNQTEDVYYERLNFFLVSESMILVAFSTVLAIDDRPGFVLYVMSVLGVLLSLVWLAVSHRQSQVISSIRKLTEDACPSYGEIRATRPKASYSSWWLLTYFVPVLTILTWSLLMFAI